MLSALLKSNIILELQGTASCDETSLSTLSFKLCRTFASQGYIINQSSEEMSLSVYTKSLYVLTNSYVDTSSVQACMAYV